MRASPEYSTDMAVLTFDALLRQIKSGNVSGVFLLHGEEGYYTDRLVEAFEELIPEADREFDLHEYYGTQQLNPYQVIDACRQCSMFSDRQVVILKEAQAMRADQVNKLAAYVLDPTPGTVFVISFRGEKAKGKDLLPAVKSKGTVFESKKVTEYNMGAVIAQLVRDRGLQADTKALEMLKEAIGTDVSRMYNEINKLVVIVGQGGRVTPEVVERNIGVSKEYNSFELVDALAVKDARKAFTIAEYFRSNPKAAPLVMVTSAIFNFFSDLLVAQYSPDKSDNGLMQALKLKSTFPLRRFRAAMQRYNAAMVIEIIFDLRRFDAMSKGVGSRLSDQRLFRELIYRILTARGHLEV